MFPLKTALYKDSGYGATLFESKVQNRLVHIGIHEKNIICFLI